MVHVVCIWKKNEALNITVNIGIYIDNNTFYRLQWKEKTEKKDDVQTN